MKFILLHHDGCRQEDFHFRVDGLGTCSSLMGLDERGAHAHSIGIVVEGHFEAAEPADRQIEALKQLLLDLHLQYPAAVLGAHRQVRGDAELTCPGRRFPMKPLAQWFQQELPAIRDQTIRTNIESQYGP